MTLKDVYNKLLEKYGYQNWWPVHEGQNSIVEIAFGAVLTQNTSWKNVEKALENLIKHNMLDFEKVYCSDIEFLKELIRPAGFYNQKAKTLKAVSKLFLEKPHKDITREDLLSIKGVGKETADSILLYALNKPYFVIDAYTKRFLSRLGLVSDKIDYDSLQSFITQNIEMDLEVYKEFHALIVKHCKELCTKKPKCEICFFKCEVNIMEGLKNEKRANN